MNLHVMLKMFSKVPNQRRAVFSLAQKLVAASTSLLLRVKPRMLSLRLAVKPNPYLMPSDAKLRLWHLPRVVKVSEKCERLRRRQDVSADVSMITVRPERSSGGTSDT